MVRAAIHIRAVGMAVLALHVVVAAPMTPAVAGTRPSVELQFLTVSDWHAQLDPLSTPAGQIGGAAVLSAYFQAERAANPNTLTLTAGDAFGASPPLSSFFNERPAVLAMNLMGFQADTFGNHNFARGLAHLQPMIDLASFRYVSANLKNVEDNLTGVKPFEIFDVGGVKVGVIGITNPEAPRLVFPGRFGSIEVTDPIPAAHKASSAARQAGATVLVAITHLGVTGTDRVTGAPVGPLIDFASHVNGIDVIFGDHTDVQFSGTINQALVVENRSKGLTYARTRLRVDPENGRVTQRSVEFVTPYSNRVTPDPAIVNLLAPFRAQLAPILGQVIGHSTALTPRADACGNSAGRTCESRVGNTVTDAMRTTYRVDFAITNSGGLRGNLTCPTTDDPADFCPPYQGLRHSAPARGEALAGGEAVPRAKPSRSLIPPRVVARCIVAGRRAEPRHN